MYVCYRKSLLLLKASTRTSSIPLLRGLLAHSYSTAASTSEKQSFRMNYLINNCGFSPETASELSRHVSFIKSQNPDAVLELLRSLNISDSNIRDIVKRAPWLLSSHPVKTISPKLEFFKSKGASSSQLVRILTFNPRFLRYSIENQIIPVYDLMKSFLHSDERTITSLQRCPTIITDCRLAQKVKFLHDYGVPESGIAWLIRHWPAVIKCKIDELKTKADEIAEMGFHPSKITFIEALRTKVTVSTSSWERKVELYRRWGWSDETLLKAFIKRPFCMLTSDSKIEAVMEFFVNQMGWDTSVLARRPILIAFSLEKRIIPRASVLQFLQSRGLIKKHADSCAIAFGLTEEMFHRKFVSYFKDEAPQLLNLYEEKLNLSR